VEAFSADKLTALLPEDMQSIFAPLLKEESDPETHELVKAADKLSAYIKCVEELSAGNEEYRQAEKQIKASLEASSLPEVAYFMEQFMPAFGLTLDELQR
jgi:5'-deoxynucleotidase